MPFGEVRLIPGVNVERTPSLLETSYAASQLIRFRDQLAEKYGGWQKFFSGSVGGTPRDLHAWEDLNTTTHLGVGTTTELSVITSSSNKDITPQTTSTNTAPDFTTTTGSTTIVVKDSNIGALTTYDAVRIDTPVTVDGIILYGLYPISTASGSGQYNIIASKGGAAGVTDGGAIPTFTTTSGSSTVTVNFASHGLQVNSQVNFAVSTTGNGVTISGTYTVATVPTSGTYTISVSTQANASSTFSMNSGNVHFVYYIALGPASSGSGFGIGGFGRGGFGTGTTFSQQTGTPITSSDWTQDNWGQLLLSCPANGALYQYDPTGGFTTSAIVPNAPAYNGGIFVSMAQQIVVAWASTQDLAKGPFGGIGIVQDPMLVRWCTVGDFYSTTAWTALFTNQAGSYRIPLGSTIVGGMAVSNQNLIWTDLDLWAMNYQGPPFVYGFNKIGAGAGLVSSHAAQQLRGAVYWMGRSNFFSLTGNGVAVIPCSVRDVVFQNLNTSYLSNIRAMPNTPHNEVGWLYPSVASSTGECDSYVKFNITEQGQPWDYGLLPRSAWIDLNVLGYPIAATSGGVIYQHESTNDADGAPLAWSFTTGYFYFAEGEDFVFVDQIYPDFKWGTYSGAQTATVNISINVINYPGDTPTVYGPYAVTQATQYVSTRLRGRQGSFTISGNDLGSFVRLGKVRYRWAQDGRR